uniref:AfsR/SARP family transcriptional regulator n=1 Tax=Paractinoplanes polyasparticus TaxID=2856853 RepID=UPI001C85008B|nr:BTAD domain-containing putative transcriptional regulator [Actinoplanes polyasparticus]
MTNWPESVADPHADTTRYQPPAAQGVRRPAVPTFRVLGPLEIRDGDGAPVSPTRRKQRVLLALLLLRAGHVVRTDEIIDALWGGSPPVSALANLHTYVSGLRQLLDRAAATGEPRPRTMPGGYQLDLRPGERDADVFESLAGEGRRALAESRPATAAECLDRALGLWRGTVLHDMDRADWLLPFAVRLEEARLTAVEDQMTARLALGHHAELTSELTELITRHPLRERLWGHLLVALHRSGSQQRAIEAYGRLRRLLKAELGVRPGPQVRQIFEAILSGDAASDTASSVDITRPDVVRPAQLPAAPAPFVGRTEHLRRLDKLIERAADTDPVQMVTCVISGPAGVGKSTLAAYWAHRVAGRYPDGQLYVNLRGFDPAARAKTPTEAVRGFLEALNLAPEQIPATLDAQAALYRSRLAGRRILVVLDNARDAEQVRPLLPGSSTAAVVVTSRNRLTPLLAVDGAHPLALDLFTRDEARALLTRRLGAERTEAEPHATEEVITACARLPLALGIAAARADHSGSSLRGIAAELGDATSRLDALNGGDAVSEVRAVFSWSYSALTSPAARLFRLLGQHVGPDISTAAAASLAGQPIPQVRLSLDELVRINLVVQHVPGRYSSHDLLRAYAADLTESTNGRAAARADVTRLMDHYTHTAHTAARLLRPHQDPIPLPLGPAAAGANPERPADLKAAMAWLTAEHPVLLATIRRADGAGFDRHAWQLAWCLDTFLTRQGHWHDLIVTWRAARDTAGRLGDLVAQAHAYRNLAHAQALLGRYTEAHADYDRALELYAEGGSLTGQARTHLQLGVVWERQGRHDLAVGHDQQALALYRAAGHLRGEADALNAVGWDFAQLGDYGQALVHCEQALDVHLRTGNRHGAAHTWDSVGFACHRLGEQERAVECFRQAIGLFRELRDRYNEADSTAHLGDACHAAGDTVGARTAWTLARNILEDLEHPDAERLRARLETV